MDELQAQFNECFAIFTLTQVRRSVTKNWLKLEAHPQ